MASKLGKLTRNTGSVKQRLENAEPLAVIVASRNPDVLEGNILGEGPHGPRGTRLRITGVDAKSSDLLRAVSGGWRDNDKVVYPTTPGDLVVFERAVVSLGESPEAKVDAVAFRVPCGTSTPVQVARAFVKPSRFSVSKRGMMQFLTIAQPALARRLHTPEDALALYTQMAKSPWPGGEPRILLCHGDRAEEIGLLNTGTRKERSEEMARRIFETPYPKGVVCVPVWSVPMGRDAQMREAPFGGVARPTEAPRLGMVSSLYSEDRYILGFRPSFLTLQDEAEWAFGGKTGKTHRVVSGYSPMAGAPAPIEGHRLPLLRDDPAAEMRFLIQTEADMTASMERRRQGREAFEAVMGITRDRDGAGPTAPSLGLRR